MKLASRKFFKTLFALSVFLVGVVVVLGKWMPEILNTYHFLMMIGFVVLVISIVHLVLVKVSEGEPQRFIRVFMIATMVKLILYFVFVLTMAFLHRDQAASLLVGFTILYFSYTTLEVYFLRKHLNSQGT